jgi:hypothetical protein
MNQSKTGPAGRLTTRAQFGLVLICLLALLGFLFRDGLMPGRTVFSNDGPLGAIIGKCTSLPSAFFGFWEDRNWLGGTGPSASPDISQLLNLLVGKLVFSKIFAPFALLFLGLSAWLCFQQWRLSSAACIVGAIAAALNSDFFSTACWGVATQPIAFGCDFLALAALADQTSPRRWIRVMLAGLAVGLGVMEAFDIGAIFSLVVAAFVVFQALADEGTMTEKAGRAFSRLALVAGFAGFIAASTVTGLIGTQIQGVAGMGQDAASKAKRWDEATMWSMSKIESLTLIVPGLFGFRMDTPNGGNYWGFSGRHPAWDRYFAGEPLRPGQTLRFSSAGIPNGYVEQIDENGKVAAPGIGEFSAAGKTLAALEQEIAAHSQSPAAKGMTVTLQPPSAWLRYGGGGLYTGVVVVLIAFWAVFQAFRKSGSAFSLLEQKHIWFWSGVGLLCVLVGFGRFAPFYQLFYALPLASTMRNPSKFFHVVEWVLVILFAYGVHGLSRACIETPGAAVRGLGAQLRAWWAKAALFEKSWVRGSLIALGVSLVGWLIYASSRDRLMAYLKMMSGLEGRGPEDAATLAQSISAFSIRQVGWYVLFLALGAGLVWILMSGYFSGRRARIGAILLGVLVAADLGRANLPWVITWDWVKKYATNPVIDELRKEPYEHRVAILPFNAGPFNQLYEIEWKQQVFRYYDIQSLDVVMMPRPPLDYVGFESAMYFDGTTNTLHLLTRRWQLTNTKYLLGPAGVDQLNQQLDPEKRRFKYATRFDLALKPGVDQFTGSGEDITGVISPNGRFALLDFTGALPRAKVYSNWRVNTNDQATLRTLASRDFDPEKVVLVSDPIPAPVPASATNQNAGMVEFSSYAPKHIVLKAQAVAPSVLLLNDNYNPNWTVTVDGKPEPLLRCNYLMRGVFLQPGNHTVEFRFEPPIGMFYVSLAAVLVGVGLVGFLAFSKKKQPDRVASPAEATQRPARATR